MLEMNRNVSYQRARDVLGWEPKYSKEEALLASIDSMTKYGILK